MTKMSCERRESGLPRGSVLIVNTDKYWTILTDMDNDSTQLHPFGGAGLRKVLVLAQALEFVEACLP